MGYEGRKKWKKNPRYISPPNKKVFWMHVSSLGEFEQGRPVLELFRKENPDWHIALTFFSPSGFEIRKNYASADVVLYLPLDSPKNSFIFLDKLNPTLAVFVKYDFWYYYLNNLKKRQIPTLLIAAKFRENQAFFKAWGILWREMIHCFVGISTQDDKSITLLNKISFKNAIRHGDPRIDRVLEIAKTAFSDDKIDNFSQKSKLIIIGSSWNSDVKIISERWDNTSDPKLLIVPHEPSEAAIAHILQYFPKAERYTQAESNSLEQARVLILDTIGMLSKVYRYGYIAYVGGGFGSGIHNTLEPAAYGLPILFGPKYESFEEASALVRIGGAFVIKHPEDFMSKIAELKNDIVFKNAQSAINIYLNENKGASHKILDLIRSLQN